MSESQDRFEGELKYRRIWGHSAELRRYLNSWLGSREEILHWEREANVRFATEYYQTSTRLNSGLHAFFHNAFLMLWISLQLIAIVFSSLGHNPVAVIVLKVVGGLTGLVAVVFQWFDANKPTIKAKTYHGLLSGVSLAISVAVSAYDVGISDSNQGKDETISFDKISLLLTVISNFLLCANSFRLVMKTIASALENSTWRDYLSLLWDRIPSRNVIWESLPDSEKIWVMRIYLGLIAEKLHPSSTTSRGSATHTSTARASPSTLTESSPMSSSCRPGPGSGVSPRISHHFPLPSDVAEPSRGSGVVFPAEGSPSSPSSPSSMRQRAVR